MANTKITELTALTQCAATDVLPIVKVSANTTKKVSISDLLRNAPAGTAGAPGIANADDQDTGILFPAANSIGVSTGGAQRLVIDSSGNVGIGTTSPARKFVVSGGSSEAVAQFTNDTSGNGADDGFQILHFTSGLTRLLNRENGAIAFSTNNTERMQIDSSGRLLLGTTSVYSPSGGGQVPVTVVDSGDHRTALVVSNQTNGSSAGSAVVLAAHGEDWQLEATSLSKGSKAFTITAGTNERLRIDSSGNVGIGTTSPARELEVASSSAQIRITDNDSASSGNCSLEFAFSGGRNGYVGYGGSNALYLWNELNNNLIFGTNNTERLRIDSSGNVGIGTSSPGSFNSDGRNLVVGTGSGGQGMSIYSGNSSYGTIYFADGTSGDALYQGGVLYNHASNFMRLDTAGAERLRIDSSGNVGIGTTSPSQQLHIASANTSSSGTIIASDSQGRGVLIESPYIGNSVGKIGISGTDSALAFGSGSSNTERMRIDSSGRLLLGTTTEGDVNADNLTIADSGNCGMTIRSGASSFGGIFFSDGTSGDAEYQGQILYDHNSNYMRFQTGASERARIDSSGNVLVGKTTTALTTVGTRIDVGSVDCSASSSSTNLGTNSGGSIRIANTNSTDNNFSNIGGYNSNGLVVNQINFINTSHSSRTGEIGFSTHNGSSLTERMRIDSSGNVGIGTSSPDYNLTIGDGSSYVIQNLKAATNEFCEFRFGDTSSVAQGKITYDNGTDSLRVAVNASERMRIDSSGRVGIGVSTMSGGAGDVTIIRNSALRWADSDGTQRADIYGDSSSNLVFRNGTSSTEHMRIANSGLSDIYGSSSTLRLRTGTSGSSGQLLGGFHSATNTSNGTQSLAIFANGNIQNTNNSYGSLSDSKLKENIVDANSQWDDIKDIRVRNYNFIEGETHTQLGVVAQEVETVSPGLVTDSPDLDEEGNDLGTVTKSVNYSVLYMKAVKALQEAMDRIETLETKVAALEAQ